jgi:protein TonB
MMLSVRLRYPALCLLGTVLVTTGCRESAPEVMPRQISESPFHYPQRLWDEYVEGETVLAIHVNEEGTVDTAWVAATSGHEAFDSAAVEGAQRLVFEPASRGGEPVAVQVLLPVQFQRQRPDSLGNVPPDPDP